MIIPVLITVGVAGLLYASRGPSSAPPSSPVAPPVPVTSAGSIARIGDTVEIFPGAVPTFEPLRFATLPEGATATGIFVQISNATPLDLEGFISGVSYASPRGSGVVQIPLGVTMTPRFPRALVVHVYRDGEQIA